MFDVGLFLQEPRPIVFKSEEVKAKPEKVKVRKTTIRAKALWRERLKALPDVFLTTDLRRVIPNATQSATLLGVSSLLRHGLVERIGYVDMPTPKGIRPVGQLRKTYKDDPDD